MSRLGQQWAPVSLAAVAVVGGLALVTVDDSFVPSESSVAGGPATIETTPRPGALAVAIDEMVEAGKPRRGASGLAGARTGFEPDPADSTGSPEQAVGATTTVQRSTSTGRVAAAVADASTTTAAPSPSSTEPDAPSSAGRQTTESSSPTSGPPTTNERPSPTRPSTLRPSTAPSSTTEVTDVEENQAPNVDSPGVRRGRRGEHDSVDISAFDPDGDPLSFRAHGLPPGTDIGRLDGLIEGTPTVAGTFTVTVTATDDQGASGEATFGWLVEGRSQGPNCGLEGAVSSMNSARLIEFRLTNETAGALDVYWLDYDGGRVRYGTVAPGETVDRPTYETQPWLLADPETGDCVYLVSDPQDGDGVVVR